MEQIVWLTIIATAGGALIGGAFAFLIISGINALMKMSGRIAKLEAGQANLREGQAKAEAGLTEIRGLLNQPRPATGESP